MELGRERGTAVGKGKERGKGRGRKGEGDGRGFAGPMSICFMRACNSCNIFVLRKLSSWQC